MSSHVTEIFHARTPLAIGSPIASGVVTSTCEFSCSRPEMPPYVESAICITVYVENGISPNTAPSTGTILASWASADASVTRGMLPDGYAAKRSHPLGAQIG